MPVAILVARKTRRAIGIGAWKRFSFLGRSRWGNGVGQRQILVRVANVPFQVTVAAIDARTARKRAFASGHGPELVGERRSGKGRKYRPWWWRRQWFSEDDWLQGEVGIIAQEIVPGLKFIWLREIHWPRRDRGVWERIGTGWAREGEEE